MTLSFRNHWHEADFISNEFVDAVILHSSIVVFEHIFTEVVSVFAHNVGTINRKTMHSTLN